VKPLLVIDKDHGADPLALKFLEGEYVVLEVKVGTRVQVLGVDPEYTEMRPMIPSSEMRLVVIADADSGINPSVLNEIGYVVMPVKPGARVALMK